MSEIPEEIKDFLDMVYRAEIAALKDNINRNTQFFAQGTKLKLYTIDTDKKKVFMTFETQYIDDSQIVEKVRRLLGQRIDKAALLVF